MWRPAALLSLSVCSGCASLGEKAGFEPSGPADPSAIAANMQPSGTTGRLPSVTPGLKLGSNHPALPASTLAEHPGQPHSVQSASASSGAVSNVHLAPSYASESTSFDTGVALPANLIQLNLPTTLSMVGGSQPIVAAAQWRVQEAYARLDQARTLWLPSLQAGFSFHNHDGNYQASNGSITDVHRNSFQYGLGAGATGAGTTPVPGISTQFHFAEAIFQPKVRRKAAWAAGHAASATKNEQMLRAAVAYTDLLKAHQDLQILRQSQQRTEILSQLTRDFAETGQGLQADADRVQTELALVNSRLVAANEATELASASLAEALSIDATAMLVPTDATMVPLSFASEHLDACTLVGTGLATRPELKEARAITSAAIERMKQVRYTPMIPSVLLGYSSGEFGGGLGNNLNNIDNRSDFDAQLIWEVRNLGFGEAAQRRQSKAQVQQARFAIMRTMDQVAREITQAHSKVRNRSQQVGILHSAIATAETSYQRNVERIRDGQGLPLEALQSLQALENANQELLNALASHNVAQFTLQWALGWPVNET